LSVFTASATARSRRSSLSSPGAASAVRVQQRPLGAAERAQPHVHERVGIALHADRVAQEDDQALAVLAARGAKHPAERGVEGERLEPAKALRVPRPALAEPERQGLGERGVPLDQPAPREHRRGPRAGRAGTQLHEVVQDVGGRALPRLRHVGP
jgi:hypothetical protein